MSHYDHLAESGHPYLRRAAERAQTLCRARCQLALADEQFGNTPASSMHEFQQKVFLPAGRYVFQREIDRAQLEEELQKQYPQYNVRVVDAPMTEASRQKLQEFLGGVVGMKADVEQRAVVSGLLAYADMAQIDRMAEFWQNVLLTLAMRCGGPAAAKPVVEVEGVWNVRSSSDKFQKLNNFKVENVSGQDLTHAVIELVARNEWGEKAAHYVYLPKLEVAEAVRLVPHFRWNRRRLDFTNTMTVTCSIWSDQGTMVGRQAELKNPAPNPDPAGWRKDYLKFDREFTAAGEALGEAMQALSLLPIDPQRQKRILAEAAAPGACYVFRLSESEKTRRTLILNFKRLAADGTTFEAEIFDPADKKPFKADTPVWTGKIVADRKSGWVIRLDADWTFQIAADDRPVLSVPGPKGGDSEETKLPLLPVKGK
ncbi:MAG: hypothetical protein HY290_02010 [Planctomycetia bacterium]|nr:hypothetical protein [Planctomycetia bacterium]